MALHNHILILAAVLLTLFLVLSFRKNFIKKLWLKRALNTTAIIAVSLMASAVAIFPDLGTLKTTGPYPYASHRLQLTDRSRPEDHRSDGSFRTLSVLLYYPDSDSLKKHSCPLIVFSHGGLSTKTSNISLYQELASHGYVVASIDHTYHALRTEINGAKVYVDARYLREIISEDSHRDIEGSYASFQRWMDLRTSDMDFIIDAFVKESLTSSSFYSLIDVENIGVAGHSLGGSAALGMARKREDIRAVLALESPYLYDITGFSEDAFIWNTEPYACAIMNIYSESAYPLIKKDHKYVQNKNHLYNEEKIEYYYIEGSNHYTLTDLVRKSPILCALLGGGYKKPGYDTLELINQKSLSFFNKYLYK